MDASAVVGVEAITLGGGSRRAATRGLGLDVAKVPENEYMIVRLRGPALERTHRGWRYVMRSFSPEHGYRRPGIPDFEAYGPGGMYATDYEMELWIPIEKI